MTTPKRSVQALRPYISGKNSSRLLQQSARIMKLDSNESSLPPSPRVMAALSEYIQKFPINWYPDLKAKELTDKLADYTGCPADFIQTFSGSDNALETICKTFIESGDEVILCMPTYDHFRVYAESNDARLVPVFGPSPFAPKTVKLIDAITAKTKIMYIVNPNNPTGMMYSKKDIELILQKAPQTIVIVDEAYFEFSGITMAGLVEKYRNLIVARSFSKAFGLAGLRCGYILTQPANLEPINKIRLGKINSLTQVAACAALDDLEYVDRYVFEVRTAKKWLYEKLTEMGLNVIDTKANFLLVEVANPVTLAALLEESQVYVRAALPQFEDFIRLTIGHQLLMERFYKVFKKVPEELLFAEEVLQEKIRVL